jgi:hypothetical protein
MTTSGGTSTSGGTPVPAPGAVLLFGAGAFATMGGRKLLKKKKQQQA